MLPEHSQDTGTSTEASFPSSARPLGTHCLHHPVPPQNGFCAASPAPRGSLLNLSLPLGCVWLKKAKPKREPRRQLLTLSWRDRTHNVGNNLRVKKKLATEDMERWAHFQSYKFVVTLWTSEHQDPSIPLELSWTLICSNSHSFSWECKLLVGRNLFPFCSWRQPKQIK